MTTKYNKYIEYIENNIKHCDISYRGGVLKVDISGLLSQKSNDAIEEAGEDAIAGASQNYLGGGIAGSITSGRMFDIELLTAGDKKKWPQIAEALKRYFYDVNNGGGDDYMQENITGKDAKAGYQRLQKMPVSGY